MNRTGNKWFQLAILNILFGCFCKGQISLAPGDVPWSNEPWTLVCSVDSIVATVTITDPSGTPVGLCDPSDTFSPAICQPSVGFAINETANTVSMTRTIGSSDTGSWTCQHSPNSGTYSLSSPLPNRTLPDSSSSYGMHSMSPTAGSEITTDTVHNFTYHYGCVSSGLKFIWTIMPDSSFEDTSNTISNGFACTTNSAYMSTIDESATILQAITSTGKKLKVSVYVDGYGNLPIVEYTYDVTFAPGDVTTEGTTEGLISSTPSSERTSEMETSSLEVTGTVNISNVLPSFESTDFTFKPGTSLNANTVSFEDSLSQVSSFSLIGSLEPTDMLSNAYGTTGIEVDSTLFSLQTMNFTDETITTGLFNSAMSTSVVTSSRNNLQTSSVSVVYITTGISLQVDLTQDPQILTSEIIQTTQTQYSSLYSSVLSHIKLSNIQTDMIPSTLSARFDTMLSDTLSFQSTSLDSFIISLFSTEKSSADTFSLSIETSPESSILQVYTSSNNQFYTSGYSRSENQTGYVPENTLIVENVNNTFSSFKIASSTADAQVLPTDTTSVGSFSPVEGFSSSLFLYSSSLIQGLSSIYTSISNTLTLIDVSSISLIVQSSYISVKPVVQSSERSMINSFLSTNESVTSMVVQSLKLSSSHNQVALSSHTFSDSQFLPITGTSSSYQLKLIATSSKNNSTQSDPLSKFTFTQLNTSSTPQSSNANKVSNVLSSTSMSFLSVDTLTFERSSQSLYLTTYSSNSSNYFSATKQPVNTPFVSSEFQFINTPLLTSVPFFLDTSSLEKFSPSTGLPLGTPSVFVDFAKESMSTTTHSLSPLSSSSTLKVFSYTDVTSISEIISSHSYHLVTSDINTIQPSETVHVFSSQPTFTTTQAPELSFLEAQIIIVSCSIAVVILVVLVPLMVMYYFGKSEISRIRQKPHDQSANDSSSSVNFPQVFNRDFVYDYPNMGKTLPVRYHSRSLSDLPYSWNFEHNWNSLTS